MRKLLLIGLSFLLLASCVSKKKYVTLQNQMAHKTDSLSKIISQNRTDFNNFMVTANTNDAHKNDLITAKTLEITNLSADTLLLKQNLKDAINEFNTEKEKLKIRNQELEKRSVDADTLEKKLLLKQKELDDMQALIDKNKKETENLKNVVANALKSFDATQLSVYQKNGKVYVKLEESLLFKSGSYKIDKKGEEAIIKLAEALAKTDNVDILVEGHTDNVGTAETNWELSTKRALAIVKIIQDNSKTLKPERITAAGRAMFLPIESNDTDAGKQKNRRCEIILTPNLEGLYKILED